MTTTTEDVITAAASIARDAAEGRLDPADLERHAVTELRALFAEVDGPEHPAWDVQTDVARQAIALGALTADELSECAAVMRRRAGETSFEPIPNETPPAPESLASEAHGPEAVEPEPMTRANLEPVPKPQPVLGVVASPPARRIENQAYDPLRSWQPGASRPR